MAEQSHELSKKREEKRSWLGDVPALLGAIAVALVIRTFFFQSFYVPSDSMYPSLLVGDHVFVNKLLYGARIPGTDSGLPGIREPKRGEVIVFRLARGPAGIYPVDLRPDLRQDAFVKRLIGLPGDRVAYHSGRLQLNGQVVPKVSMNEVFTDESGRVFDIYREDLPGCSHYVLDDRHSPGQDMAEIQIKPGRYLFLGDNRDNSYDGRMVGTVRSIDMAGPAGLLYWSWDWNGSWLALINPLTWLRNLSGKTRWSRIGLFHACLPPNDGGPPQTAAG